MILALKVEVAVAVRFMNIIHRVCMAGFHQHCGKGCKIQFVLYPIVYVVAVQPPTDCIYLNVCVHDKTSILKVTLGWWGEVNNYDL